MSSKQQTKRETKMTDKTFKVNLSGITSLDCFRDASKDELKILVYIIASQGEEICVDALAEELGISRARVKACITLFEESGVIAKCHDGLFAEVEYEFELANSDKKDRKDSSLEVAKSIRDNDLYELNLEMENIFEKTLEAREIERITSLYTKKGLSPEYILTLSAHLKDKRQVLSVEAIVREANKLIAKGIDTLEELEVYVKEKNEEIAGEMEMRRLFGIYGRTLTKTEREHFKRWMHEYGYSATIIGEAYDVTVAAINKISLQYINSILTEWHNSDCKTLEECRAKINTRKHDNTKNVNNNTQKQRKSITAEIPKYTDFNSEDALLRALERSYGDEKN